MGIFTVFASTHVRMFTYKIIIKAKAKAFTVYDIPYACAKVPAGLFHIRISESVFPFCREYKSSLFQEETPLINLKSFTGIFFQKKTGNYAVFYPVIFWNLFKK